MPATSTLPQLGDHLFLTDGGLETDLIFNRGVDLPQFASFVLHDDRDGEEMLRDYFRGYLQIASEAGSGLILESATWRASTAWGEQLGYDAARVRAINRRAVQLLVELRERETDATVVISGCIGPRGDAYADLGPASADDAARYHREQVEVLADFGADLVSALTLTNVAEAVGITRAAQELAMPVVISFTVETDGALPTGMTLCEAVNEVDRATGDGPAYYMVNCAHPDHFGDVLEGSESALQRVRGVRANASRASHAELDESEKLDDGDPDELGGQLAALRRRLPHVNVLGGCCGTDSRHIAAIARACSTR